MKPTLFIAFLIAAALAYNHAIAPESPLGITAATTTPAIADNIEVHYYRIHGVSAEALRDEMNRKGPLFNGKRFDAVTRWHVYWQFQYDMHGSRCVMRDVQTRTETNMTLPRWETRSTARQPLQQQWDAYYAALIAHENGHANFAIQAAAEIDKALIELTASDCNSLTRQANDTAMQIVQSHAEREKEYDRSTNHGMNEGARFP